MSPLSQESLDQLFNNARTHNAWKSKNVPDELLHQLFELTKMAPTSANSSPMRLVFVKSHAAKEKLKPALSQGNLEKTMAAPVVVIIAYDLDFYEHLPMLFPHDDARSWFAGREAHILKTAVLNGSLQGGYLIMAARALGLDCGPMSGFNSKKVDEAFFADTNIKSNFLLNLGYGDEAGLYPRGPRFNFDDVCSII
jgi:3-hydroxypropanoate dehydrogenase